MTKIFIAAKLFWVRIPDLLNGAELDGNVLYGHGPGGPQACVPHPQTWPHTNNDQKQCRGAGAVTATADGGMFRLPTRILKSSHF